MEFLSYDIFMWIRLLMLSFQGLEMMKKLNITGKKKEKFKIVENHRIFSRLPFFVHYPSSFYALFCFLFVPLFCIYIGVSILCNSSIQ